MVMRFTSVVAVLALAVAACGGTPSPVARPVHSPERVTPPSAQVSDDAFAGAVRDLVASEPGSQERQARLAGVVSRQMTRAASRFARRSNERALATLTGGLALVRPGELKPDVLGPNAAVALRSAAIELSKKGDEGRARAIYEIIARTAPPPESAAARGHLDAISAWVRDTSGSTAIQAAGGQARAAVDRALLEPSPEALSDAITKTTDWLARALALRASYRSRRVQPSREEAQEALRAMSTGGVALVALHVRIADANGALAAIEKAQARELVSPDLMRAVERAAAKPSAPAWLEVARALRPASSAQGGGHDPDDDEPPQDPRLVRAAAFGCVLEAYRLDATLPEAAASLAAFLMDYGMAEATPTVLGPALKASADSRLASLALGMTLRAMVDESQGEEPDAARRTFAAAAPLLELADDPKLAREVNPSPARLRATMGEIEVREGRLAEARALLERSLTTEKTAATLLPLARIDWHDKKSVQALARLREAQGLADAKKDVGLEAELLLMESDILREDGDARAARQPLAEALQRLAKARATTDSDDRARIERGIARALDRFGATVPATRALDRALEAAPHDKRQAAATVGQQVARALVLGDLKTARDALQKGLAYDLDTGDLVYYAMWVRILERQAKVPGDGMAERLLVQIKDDPRWQGKIASFGLGLVKSEDLIAAAQSPAQKAEALFYGAMLLRAQGDAKGGDDGLRQVVAAGGLELMETGIARDILSGPRARLAGPAPEVGLP